MTIGMALSAPTARTAPAAGEAVSDPVGGERAPAATPSAPGPTAPATGPAGAGDRSLTLHPTAVRSPGHRPVAELPTAVVAWLAANGSRAASLRALADAVGRPPSSVSDAVRRLVADRRVVVGRGRGGATTVELASIGKMN